MAPSDEPEIARAMACSMAALVKTVVERPRLVAMVKGLNRKLQQGIIALAYAPGTSCYGSSLPPSEDGLSACLSSYMAATARPVDFFSNSIRYRAALDASIALAYSSRYK